VVHDRFVSLTLGEVEEHLLGYRAHNSSFRRI
jgi:hypothetical protein